MKTVLHLTSDDPADWGHALRSAGLLATHTDLHHEDVVLLPHHRGIGLVSPTSAMADEVAELLHTGMTILAGATCFDATDRPREALPGVEIVDSGVSEIVRRQADGYHQVKIP